MQDDEWLYNLVDIIAILTDNPEPRPYLMQVKRKILDIDRKRAWKNGTFIAPNDNVYPMDAANFQGLLRILEFVSSPKVTDFRLWLAEVGKESAA